MSIISKSEIDAFEEKICIRHNFCPELVQLRGNTQFPLQSEAHWLGKVVRKGLFLLFSRVLLCIGVAIALACLGRAMVQCPFAPVISYFVTWDSRNYDSNFNFLVSAINSMHIWEFVKCYLTLYCLNYFFIVFSGHSLR